MKLFLRQIIRQITPPFLLAIAKSFIKTTPPMDTSDPQPIFTNTWFADPKDNLELLLSTLKPTRVLEIGSYEGASVCFLIETLAKSSAIEIHCIDTWAGGVEHRKGGVVESDMTSVETRFHHNTQLAMTSAPNKVSLIIHKGPSDLSLSQLLTNDKQSYFDYIYVDGSHQAPDVLFDAVASFKLLRVGGIMAFDDYLWAEDLPYGTDPLRCPKPAIDAFVNLNIRKLKILRAPLGQLYIQKLSD